MEEKYSTISIPSSLFEKIKKQMESSKFDSVSNYVTYVLNEVFSEEEEKEVFTPEEEEKIKERLRGLGYLE